MAFLLAVQREGSQATVVARRRVEAARRARLDAAEADLVSASDRKENQERKISVASNACLKRH
jgi:hypothetical protein